ncbi:MAG: hypothetical protein KGP14_01835 [Betaproteobacteria bacterium]|nr:hypothetical protein [Betaproteobacteria bacterium]
MKQPLFQVNVETRDGRLLAVGPAMVRQGAELFMQTIKEQIAAGREKQWSNPHLAQILHLNS